MPAHIVRRLGGAIAILITPVAWVLLFAAPTLGSEPISCAYLEAGAAGPPGNVLRIEDGTDNVTHIYRQGDEIIVFNNSASDPTTCTGGTPTVFNVDQIEYFATANSVPFIDYIGPGPLAPGATPEASGSEIEISVHESYHPEVLNVGGSAASDTMVVGQLGPHQIGVNLNAQADGANQDADVVMATVDPSQVFVRLVGRPGDDTLSGLGGPEFTGPLPADRLSLSGGPGNDTMIGGPHHDLIRGDLGNDTMIGSGGDDLIKVGPGRDLAKAGAGRDRIENESNVGGVAADTVPDRVFAGPGNDQVDVSQLSQPLPGDFVSCGPGRHDLAIIDPGDRAKACEKVDVERR
jgi:Ca2+-binding RTX toxin-like protein